MTRLSDDEEQQAQHIACSHLVKGCEDAVLAAAGASERQSPTKRRAREILAQVLSSWRHALKALRTVGEPVPARIALGNLDGWTSDELFAETLTRTGGDPPALRLMQDEILRALLTAHDLRLAPEHLTS